MYANNIANYLYNNSLHFFYRYRWHIFNQTLPINNNWRKLMQDVNGGGAVRENRFFATNAKNVYRSRIIESDVTNDQKNFEHFFLKFKLWDTISYSVG